ncbi:MAG: triose-phosphate isomerase [Elusimicrobia bacterium]|nr:triose-phosphate isomerase [Elusimicrobiota bacterium]
MRKPLVAANWKMNKNLNEVLDFAGEFSRKLPHGSVAKVDIVICPAFTHLAALTANSVLPGGVVVGGQDSHWEEKGAFTGCISPVMLKDLRVRYVIVGHSERRQYFSESSNMLAGKLTATLKAGLIPIFCVGEKLEERQTGRTFKVLEEQMTEALQFVPKELASDSSRFILAYEPVWAIGTGQNATPGQAQEAHKHLRGLLAWLWGAETAGQIRILYGGSVTPDNFAAIMACPDVDGGLVGGASLDAERFVKLIEIAAAR